jgi:hypothetical protein
VKGGARAAARLRGAGEPGLRSDLESFRWSLFRQKGLEMALRQVRASRSKESTAAP